MAKREPQALESATEEFNEEAASLPAADEEPAVSARATEAAGSEDAVPEGQGAETDEAPAGPDAAEDNRQWYVIHSYSGYENKVKKNLEQRIESMDMHGQIFQVIVPTVDEVELRDGQRRTVARRVFPGYILVHMIMTDDSWYVVRNTPGVTGFVGMGNRPTSLSQEEVDKILKRIASKTPQIRISFRSGQKVRIVEGPFVDFVGSVHEVYEEKLKVKILVSFFGRETPVELDYLQVERV